MSQQTATLNGVSVSGTMVEFNYADSSPRYDILPAQIDTIAANARVPHGLFEGQPYEFAFQTNPIRAPLAPVSLVGRTVVDLSVSGTADQPLLFNSQAIIDSDPLSQALPLAAPAPLPALDRTIGDVVVMFAPDGRLDAIYSSVARNDGTNITHFDFIRTEPATTVSFNVGFVDGILGNIDDGARFPNAIPGTNFAVNNGDPDLAAPYSPPSAPAAPVANPVVLNPDRVPNFANSDCAWVSVQPLSGAIRLDTVASQPFADTIPVAPAQNDLSRFIDYYNLNTSPTDPSVPLARAIVGARVRYSRRLASSGATL